MARLTMALLTMSYSLTTHLAHEEGSALGHDGEVELVQVLARVVGGDDEEGVQVGDDLVRIGGEGAGGRWESEVRLGFGAGAGARVWVRIGGEGAGWDSA